MGGGQKARVGVNRATRMVEVERGVRASQHYVGFVERGNGSDVSPIAIVQIGAYAMARQGSRQDVAAKILLVPAQHIDKCVAREDIDAKGCDEGLLRAGLGEGGSGRDAGAHFA